MPTCGWGTSFWGNFPWGCPLFDVIKVVFLKIEEWIDTFINFQIADLPQASIFIEELIKNNIFFAEFIKAVINIQEDIKAIHTTVQLDIAPITITFENAIKVEIKIEESISTVTVDLQKPIDINMSLQ